MGWVSELMTSIVGLPNVIKDVRFNWNQVTGTFPLYVQLASSRRPLVRMWLATGMGSVYFGNTKTDFSFEVLTIVLALSYMKKIRPFCANFDQDLCSWSCLGRVGSPLSSWAEPQSSNTDEKWHKITNVLESQRFLLIARKSHPQYTKESVLS